jgi:hypothetical protein
MRYYFLGVNPKSQGAPKGCKLLCPSSSLSREGFEKFFFLVTLGLLSAAAADTVVSLGWTAVDLDLDPEVTPPQPEISNSDKM